MKVFEVQHDGIWLGGLSIVVAENEARALSLTKFAMVEHRWDVASVRVIRELDLQQERCYVLDNGDY